MNTNKKNINKQETTLIKIQHQKLKSLSEELKFAQNKIAELENKVSDKTNEIVHLRKEIDICRKKIRGNITLLSNNWNNVLPNVVFVILRHVVSVDTNKMWYDCYESIRNKYSNKIIIIDDNSDPRFVSQMPLTNCEILQSEFPGAGELLPYYYFEKYKWDLKMIYLQDSMLLQDFFHPQSILKVNHISFLWYFATRIWDNTGRINKLSVHLKNYELFKHTFDEKLWHGCFGVCSVVTLNFINKLNVETGILNLVHEIKNREDRKALERIFGVCCFMCLRQNNNLFGNITTMPHHFRIFYEDYLNDSEKIKEWCTRANVIKMFCSR